MPETDNIYIRTNVEEHFLKRHSENAPVLGPRQPLGCLESYLVIKHSAHTKLGVPIDKLPNQSKRAFWEDSVAYIWTHDSYALRDLGPIRRTGFGNNVGQQANTQICPTEILSAPGNRMIKAYHLLQHTAFNPDRWALHPTNLLTT